MATAMTSVPASADHGIERICQYKGSNNATIRFYVAKSTQQAFAIARNVAAGRADVTGFGPNAFTAHGGLSVLLNSTQLLSVTVYTGGATPDASPVYDVAKAVTIGQVLYPKLGH
ncbi:MAG: hypothetical protein ACYDAD_02905 [Acidimicrobiales bacterium]